MCDCRSNCQLAMKILRNVRFVKLCEKEREAGQEREVARESEKERGSY